MSGTHTRQALFAVAGCLLLTGCGPAKSSGVAAGRTPVSATAAATPASTAAATTADGGGGLTACTLITEQDASTVIGSDVGPGTPGGSTALSECIYDQGSLIIGMKTDSKAFYDKSHAAAHAKGATDLSGIGDSAFQAGTDGYSTLLLLKGTTLVSILFSGTDAKDKSVAVAKVAASKI